MSGATAEPAVPIAPASPTFTPYVPIKAEVICMDGNAPALKLNKDNCVGRYTPVYEAVRCVRRGGCTGRACPLGQLAAG